MSMLMDGWTTKDIACELGLSYRTVRQYIAAIHSRLGVHSRTELILWGFRQRLVERRAA